MTCKCDYTIRRLSIRGTFIFAYLCLTARSTRDYGEDIGVRQDLEIDYDRLDEVQDALYLAREYLSTYNFSKYPDHPHLKVDCKNKHQLCGLWSAMGECERNPLFMNTTCAPVCQACEYLLVEVRCPLDPDAVDAWYPDDLQRMFERITMDPQYSPYEPKVVSHPDSRGGQPAGPWIVVLDNFVSESEAERLIALSTEAWNDRPDTITLALDGSNRTHCEASCHDDPVTQALLQRIETLTHVPQANYEHLHMVRFGPGSFPLYTHDHDFDPEEARRQQGVRIFSLFMFLNDLDHGGSLSFPAVNLNITARLGRAVLWPLVLNDDPNRNDNRTAHAGLPFHQGNKYGMWFLY